MNIPLPRFQARSGLAILIVLTILIGVSSVASQKLGGLNSQEKRGKQIYLKGESPAGEITATLGAVDLEVPASSFSCANCHGLRGEGTREGGIQPPPLRWDTLTRPYTSALTRRERPAYNETTLARAISDALDSTGRRLHPAMPNYKMHREQMADLIAYLKQLGGESDTEPGITDDSIQIGAVLPLTGPLAQIGEDTKAIITASFAEVNSQGGIYGRRIELVTEDSRGEPLQTLEATRRLIEKSGVFAMLSNFETGDSAETGSWIKSREVPLIGPLTLSPRLASPPNPYIFYLLPTFADQARSLVDFAKSNKQNDPAKPPRLAVVYDGTAFSQDALSGLQSQAKMYSMELVAELPFQSALKPEEVVGQLSNKSPDYVFFFGNAEDLKLLAAQLDRVKLNVSLLSSVVMAGRGAFALPPNVAAKTFLSYPAALPNQEDFAEFLALTKRAGISLRSPAFQSLAYASTKVFFEAAKLSGKQLDRAALINSLEQLQNFKTGVVPPLTFGKNRRVGSISSYIVGVDLIKQQYIPLTNPMTPRDKP
ncbi:MAG TPA: ABC transporter substrate-binding protein [Pyrinomonadaceae bacterium]|nr:ABC transporter substrate-binding protein [Pyrinomonadaceae bacterium]